MAVIYVKNCDSVDSAIKKFKKKVEADGIMDELRSREYYVSKGLKKRLKRQKNERARLIAAKRAANKR